MDTDTKPSPTLRVVCCSCKAVMVDGPADRVSHGICAACEGPYRAELGLAPRKIVGALLLSLALAGSAMAAEGRLMVGAHTSSGLGEESLSGQVLAQASGRWLLVEGLADSAGKLESGGRGYLQRGSADLRLTRRLSLGAGRTHRDGGAWTKSTTWARVGIGDPRTVRVIFEHGSGEYAQDSWRAEVQARADVGRLTLEARPYVLRHVQGTGYGIALLVGGAR